MFTAEKEELEQLGAEITTREIRQQPELWQETVTLYHENQTALENFLKEVQAKAQGKRTRVIFTGAGTSQYVGDTVVPYLRAHGDTQAFSFESIGTTDIVAKPEDYLIKDEPTLLVSFARSGNSPESLAAVEVANQVVETIHHLAITCAEEGQLAQISQKEENSFLFLMPTRSNDGGFAMTGSFSCMTLGTLLLFDQTAFEQKQDYVTALIKLGEEVLSREEELNEIVNLDFERIVYVNNTPYTRDYDLDILEEVHGDEIAAGVFAIAQPGKRNFSGSTIEYSAETALLPDGYLALADIMVAQTVALLTSIKVGNKPDTPSPTGTVNRVVKGVTIYDYK